MLVDAGVSAKRVADSLTSLEIDPESIDAVLLTHEHHDHIHGIPRLSRRFGYKTYAVEEAARAQRRKKPALIDEPGVTVVPIDSTEPFEIGELKIRPFSVSHDAVDPVMFVFEFMGRKLGYCTDLGVVTRLVRERLRGVHALVIESNHDPTMLLEGPYRPADKRRVKGRYGHLSNEEAQELVRELCHPGLSSVTLAHLSQVNNTPRLAYDGMRAALDAVNASDCEVRVAYQDRIGTPVIVPEAPANSNMELNLEMKFETNPEARE
ncbi:MAG: MBL fold metallo-hydrolase [Deltaproteobacteria bacterium]|nr:MBL fold metallo-hydrolase [Deltaproteobacteria bacterium]